jgi:hypothetical protein
MEVHKHSIIAVWFSCGAASAVASKLIMEKYGDTCEIRILNNPVVEEHEDNLRFLKDVQEWLDHPIESVVNPDYPSASAVDVWARKKYMSGVTGASCTLQLKKKARQHWENNNYVDWHVLGFTSEEVKRHERFVLTERDNVIPILIEQNYSKQDCYDRLLRDGIDPPAIYKLGYPNANCIGCVKATSPTYWNHVRSVHPDVFEQRAVQSREIGARLARHKGKRIFLDELPSDAIGRPMKNLDFECGIFCEEIK